MKLVTVLSLVFLCTANAVKTHPIAAVIELLDRLQDQVQSEAEAEERTFLLFKKWCNDNGVTLAASVALDQEAIDTLTLFSSSKSKESATLNNFITHLQREIDKYESEEFLAGEMRTEENGNWITANQDLADTITAVGEAVTALKASESASLLQVSHRSYGPNTALFKQQKALSQLLQKPLVLEQLSDGERDSLKNSVYGPEDDAILDREKYAKTGATYTFKGNKVINLLNKLQTLLSDKRVAAQKAETAAASEHSAASAARQDAIAAAKKTKTAKDLSKGDVDQDLNAAQNNLKNFEQPELSEDEITKQNTARTCRLKKTDFEARTKTRAHEMAAMRAAEEVLAKVSGVRTTVATAKDRPTTVASPTLFLQIDNPKMKAVSMLKQRATQKHSKQLLRFANEIKRKLMLGGPFDVINSMVQKMIWRLMDEQKKEDEHKQWCDLELSNSVESQSDKNARKNGLAAQIRDATAVSSALTLKIKELNDKEALLVKYMAEATEVRQENKQENKKAIKDSEEAQTAIAKAQAVLSEFYKHSGAVQKESWEFLQVKRDDGLPEASGATTLPKEPATWASESYTSTENPETGVMAVLMATAGDFSKMEADSRSQETTDQQQFDADMKEAVIDKARTAKEAEMKTDEKSRTDDKVRSLEKKLKQVTSEHEAVTKYLSDLDGSCKNGDSSYADRKQARDDEVAALRSALESLQTAFKEETPAVGDEPPASGDETPSTGDGTPSTGDEDPATGGFLHIHKKVSKKHSKLGKRPKKHA